MPPEVEPDIEAMPDTDVTPMKDEADAVKAEQSADAPSSSAEDVSKPATKDTLSIVRDVVGQPEEAVASSAEKAAEVEPSATETETTKQDDPEYSDVPFNKHPRFQEVLTKLKTAEADAVRYRNVDQFITSNGLTGQEAADFLQIAALAKRDPVAAWPLMQPFVQNVLRAAGEVLPNDLQARVSAGEIPLDVAREISRSRASMQSVEARTAFEREQAVVRQTQDAQDAIQATVKTWETDRKIKDPNFEAKMPALQREIAWLQKSEGRPQSPVEVQQQLQKAYDAVSATYSPPKPVRQAQPRAITPVTGGQVTGTVTPAKPQSTLDVIKAVVSQRTA